MVLQNDIDLLNPPAELEKRKHKLKRLVQSPNSFFMVRFPPSVNPRRQMPGMLQHNNCIQPLSDRCSVWKLSDCSVPAHRCLVFLLY
ncbi:hypothetical protein Bca4012_014026 [Brassica carinata]